MVTRRISFLGLALLAAWLPAVAEQAVADVVVVDDGGFTVRLGEPAKRIVSLSPHLTELLFEGGAERSIVGADAHSDYPPAAREIIRIGDARGIDMEGLLRLRPDLVVAWRSGNSRTVLARLRALSIPVFESEPKRLEDIPRTIERLGVLAGTREHARLRAEQFNRRLSALASRYSAERPLRVFYEIWHRPLMTVGDTHLIANTLATCGARSALPGLAGVTATPSREAVLLADPDAIVVASVDPGGATQWQKWRQLQAVRRQGIIHIDPERIHRPTSRMLDELTVLCGRIDELRGPSGGSAIRQFPYEKDERS